ncbi:hypothetical protein OBBRIDRAFT_754491 [Obba rivulosa]|uniref:Vacuole protein n=1 Tax=Obba rivulosa TaxID=1052685 RepID=A0A8E2AYT4_9APHY|nr:hypothetical protein OBBRIDRAFT_754491 [Obba rivulosa]
MCGGPAWKREVVPDHKFDFVDTREFTDNSCGMRAKYLWIYIAALISFLVYISDIFTAITMLSSTTWSNQIFNSCPPDQENGCVYIPFSIGKWLFFGCIIASFLLLAYEARKAKKIIASRDISYAFTNVMANNYYSMRSYDHFCFFNHIRNSTKRSDDFAFFVFFTFKSWKRLLLADGPRQSINALTLYAFYLSKEGKGPWYDVSKYFAGNDYITSAITVSTTFTVFVFCLSCLMLIVAGICYIPLLCYIKGNLKEYCCHKVDKRIAEIIKRRNKQRLAKAAAQAKKEAAGDFSHLKNKKGELIAQPLPQPTLPNISLDDDDDTASIRTRGPAASAYTAQNDYYYADRKGPDYGPDYSPQEYPPMPAYNQPYGFNPSVGTLPDEQGQYDDDYGSVAHLPMSAAPFARSDVSSPAPSYVNWDPQAVYQGNTSHGVEYAHQHTDYGYAQQGHAQQDYMYAQHEYAASSGRHSPAPMANGRNSPAPMANGRQSPVPMTGRQSPSPSRGLAYDDGYAGHQPQYAQPQGHPMDQYTQPQSRPVDQYAQPQGGHPMDQYGYYHDGRIPGHDGYEYAPGQAHAM